MNPKSNLTGQRFNQLLALRLDPGPTRRESWICRCDCGKELSVTKSALISGQKTCGCGRRAGLLAAKAAIRGMGIAANNRIDLSGQRFGALTVAGYARTVGKQVIWKCKCDCGNECEVKTRQLTHNKITCCGCITPRIESHRKGKASHGLTGTDEHNIWSGMINRCMNPRNKAYPDYGGRGIRVCERWLASFADFLADMGARPSKEHSIDRIDCDGHYEPGNCRWATKTEQNNNKTNNHKLTFEGKTQTVTQWARELGIDPLTILKREQRRLPMDKILRAGRLTRQEYSRTSDGKFTPTLF